MTSRSFFRKGQVVVSYGTAVLVTGPGEKGFRYPVFAGVVIMSDLGRVSEIGTYSKSWPAHNYHLTDLKISNVVHEAFKGPALPFQPLV